MCLHAEPSILGLSSKFTIVADYGSVKGDICDHAQVGGGNFFPFSGIGKQSSHIFLSPQLHCHVRRFLVSSFPLTIENQERAYIAASHRTDRNIEARMESARKASEIHKRRTGKALLVTCKTRRRRSAVVTSA
ncbi:hypothetical protein BC936DRAFT_144017 [Jimgerdemannia flammicorona]|uniref:Uncharacterized protein n=1 Tax=Jimgerdemannia flammicorona TaxID=994334 RepID=A0A432ZYA6_9FUNG|nr:hypothetical protein BC936DRAFT_144017 [Jimgerdemannia flammicorona]